MNNTYREVFDDELDDVKAIKIKHIDRKHQKARVCDGSHKHGIVDDDSGVYYETPNQKKAYKKTFKKRVRHNNKNIAYDEEGYSLTTMVYGNENLPFYSYI